MPRSLSQQHPPLSRWAVAAALAAPTSSAVRCWQAGDVERGGQGLGIFLPSAIPPGRSLVRQMHSSTTRPKSWTQVPHSQM